MALGVEITRLLRVEAALEHEAAQGQVGKDRSFVAKREFSVLHEVLVCMGASHVDQVCSPHGWSPTIADLSGSQVVQLRLLKILTAGLYLQIGISGNSAVDTNPSQAIVVDLRQVIRLSLATRARLWLLLDMNHLTYAVWVISAHEGTLRINHFYY